MKIDINSLGYRGGEFSEKKHVSVYRVLFIGDSMVFGGGVRADQTVAHHLKRELQVLDPDRPIEVINAGLAGGYAPDTYEVYLRHRGLNLSPDLVLMSFVPRYDLLEIRLNKRIMGADGHIERVEHRTLRVVGDRIFSKYFLKRLVQRAKDLSPGMDTIIERLRRSHLREKDRSGAWAFMRNPDAPRFRENWKIALQSMITMRQLLANQYPPVPFVVVLIPERHEVHREPWVSQELWDAQQPQQVSLKMTQAAGISCLDLLPSLRAFGQQERQYFQVDPHWNATGHQSAARIIADQLRPIIRSAAPIVSSPEKETAQTENFLAQ